MSHLQPIFTNPNLTQMHHLHPSSPKQKPLSKINQSPSQQDQQSSSQHLQQPQHNQSCNTQQIKQYLINWAVFVVAFVIFLLIWVIGHFSIERLTSYYYFNPYNISPYTTIDFWKLSSRATNTTQQTYVQSTTLYTSDSLKQADAIVLSLLFSWIMWKFPLVFFVLTLVKHRVKSMLSYAIWGFYLLLLLLIDVMTTVFKPEGYQDWIFFVIYIVLSVVLVGLSTFQQKRKHRQKLIIKNLTNYLLPILYITLAYACYTILIPAIYHSIYSNINADAPYIIAHIFPIIDLISYSLIALIIYYTSSHTIPFVKMLYFLNTGYAVGHVILFSPEDVEFYYIVTYLFVRNFVFNWVLQRVQKYVINPVSLPGWIMIYLVSLCINFIPFTGLGKLVVSTSFYSQLLQLTLPIQSYTLQSDYFTYNASQLPQVTTYNTQLKSNIQLSSVFIVWVLLSISQKYHVTRVEIKDLVFYVFGVYLFYFGLTTGVQLYYLQANSL